MTERPLFTAILALGIAGCATTGATFNSGVGDSYPDRAPFYAGRAVNGDSVRASHLPITFQRGATQSPNFEPAAGPGSELAALLADMNAHLTDLHGGAASLRPLPGTPPDVQFGCPPDPGGDCPEADERPAGWQPFRLAIARPSAEWIAAAADALTEAGATHLLVLTLEIGETYAFQRNVLGAKEVRLGTGYTVDVPWLTSLNMPVQVLQLTGALVGPDGRAVRIGAEGLFARRTSLPVSALGAQRLISDDDIAALRNQRRDDLPGRPLVWQEAVRQLNARLTGRAP